MSKKPNLIQSLLLRTKERERAKQEYDSILTLSAEKNSKDKVLKLSSVSSGSETVRLLDEGMVVTADSYPLFYIKKGAIENYYESLSEDYIGSINVGHLDFATFPFLVGQWTKKDLTVVDIGDGRKGLDVDLHLDEDSMFVKELKRVDYPIGVSSEFFYEIDWDSSEEFGIEIVESINIKDFAIVGEAGNVGSSNINLSTKENNNMSEREKKSIFERFFTKYEEENKQLGSDKKEPENPADPKDPKDPKDPEGQDPKDPNATVKVDVSIDTELAEKLEDAAVIIEEQASEIEKAKEDQERALSIMEQMEQHITTLEAENKKLSGSNAKLSSSAERGLSHFESVVKKLKLDVDKGDDSNANKEKDKPVITNGFGEV